MAKIKIPSPVIAEEVKEAARLEREEIKLKEQKRRVQYLKYLNYLNRKGDRIKGGLNTTK
jgi:hypothetical protein